jgi:uncharacterized protein
MAIPSFPLFERLYRRLAGRRKAVLGVTLLVVLASVLASTRLTIQEDIVAMLPDDGSSAAQEFRLLQLAPFTRKLVITVKGGDPANPAALVAAADGIADRLRSEKLGAVTTGPADVTGNFFGWLTTMLPNLAAPEDLTKLDAASRPPQVAERLRESYERLLSPEGWALKGSIQNDPLSFSTLALEKLRYLNLIPNLRLVQNHFVSADGRSAMVVLECKVPMTDSAGSRQLLERVDAACAGLPKGLSASVVSGHRYTLANADTIKRDLSLVLTFNAIAVLVIYLVFLRSLSAIFVFLVPSSILVIATGFMGLWDADVFAVTLGFGGVLLGIADEYAMLIYFSCRQGGKGLAEIVGEVARPVLFGAAATLLSFAVMLWSALPGQRQLAIYSMVGIVAALVIALVVLPHLVTPAPEGRLPVRGLGERFRLPRRLVIGIWLALLALSGWQATKVRFNGDLRAVSLVTPELRRAEDDLARTWGDMRGKALIFAEGKTLEEAMALNDRVFERLSRRLPPGELVSLAPLVPGPAQQQANRDRWRSFWEDGRATALSAELTRAGAAHGFAPDAFAPFLATLRTPAAPATLEGLREAGMGELVDSLVIRSPDAVRVLTLAPDTPQAVAEMGRELQGMKGVRLVSQSRFGDSVGHAIMADFSRYLTLTCSLVLLLLAALFRSLKRVLLVLVPVLTGLLCSFGIMGMLGLEFNIFNIAATILIIGLCVDYGIFMVCRLTEGSSHAADRAVLVSGLTTLAGLGALALARHPSMHSIGITVLLGIGTGIPAALLVIPALCRKEGE